MQSQFYIVYFICFISLAIIFSEDSNARTKKNEDMKAALEKERLELENKFKKEQEELKEKMVREAKEREKKEKEMQQKMDNSKESGRNEVIELFEKVKKELAERKKENEELRNLLSEENSKRLKESNDIKMKMDREQLDLKEYIDQENFDGLDVGKHPNDTIFLFKSMKLENDRRKRENDELQSILLKDKQELQNSLMDGDKKMQSLLDKETEAVRRRLEDQARLASDLQSSLGQQLEDERQRLRSLSESLLEIRGRVEQPVVYFAAVSK